MNMVKNFLLFCTVLAINTTTQPCATCLTKLNQKDKPFFIRHLSMQKTSTTKESTVKNDKKPMQQSMKTVMK